jgi:Na+/proline symporter
VAQELIAVILASHTPQVARRAAVLGGGIYLVFGLIPVFIGLVGAGLLPGLEHPEQLLPQIAQKYLGTLPYIVFVGAIASAILSTVAGALLAAAALVEHNLVVPLKPGLDNRTKVRVARAAVVGGGLFAYILARHAGGVYELVEQASAFGSSGVFTVVVLGLFTRLGRQRAAYAALTAGMATWLAGHYLLELPVAYLLSLAMAMTAYLAVAFIEPRAPAHTQN